MNFGDGESREGTSALKASLVGLAVGLAGWGFVAGPIGDFGRAVSHPAPLVYTEGVMMWASREMDRGNSPYGEIDSIPSRYFCYGPAMPGVVALLAHDGPSYLRAGRILSGVFLVMAAGLCWLLAARLGAGLWGGLAAGVFLFLAIFCSHHAWSFRVDTMVVAVGLGGAAAALAHSRGGGAWWLVLAGVCGLVGGATKFTACFWGLWIFLICGGGMSLEDHLRRRDWRAAWRGVGGTAAFGGGWLLGVVSMEFAYPGAIGDQVFSQAGSGINPWGYSRYTIIDSFVLAAIPWLAAVGAGLWGGGWRLAGIAAAAWVLSTGMLLKFGSDINYYFDAFALVSVAGAVGLARAWGGLGRGGALVGAAAGFFLSAFPVKENMPHRISGADGERELVAARESAYLFRGKAGLCEDPFFPVYHGAEVLVSDPFQASLSPGFSARARKLAARSGRVVAGERLGRALGGDLWGNFVGARWTRSAGVPGVGIYLPSDGAKAIRQRHPDLKFQAAPSELRFFARGGEVLDWRAVADAYGRLGGGRRARLVGEAEHTQDYGILSGDGGTLGW